MCWNGYPNSVKKSLLKNLKTKCCDSSTSHANKVTPVADDSLSPEIWIRIPYLGNRGDFFLILVLKYNNKIPSPEIRDIVPRLQCKLLQSIINISLLNFVLKYDSSDVLFMIRKID